MSTQKWRIPATEGLGFRLSKGQTVRITDVEGEQIADIVAYRADNPAEKFDPTVTMDALRKMKVTPGDILYSTRYTPLLTLVADTVGQHDFINSACRPEMYEFTYRKKDHACCYHNLNRAIAQFGIEPPEQHYPFNLFMHTVIQPDGSIHVKRPLSKAGDYVDLRAETDLLVAMSACPASESICNGYVCTPIEVQIL
ncbi:DUF1989 domain-containing protein [Paenibacillus chitinolyticus]|uniref:DUF1989 domain-containing protein n=1 Tax=Paenibacillus chitinolyticus TaxID=79263 RepID=UPI0038685C8B